MKVYCKDCKWFCQDDGIESCAESIVMTRKDGRKVYAISYVNNKRKNPHNNCKDYEEKNDEAH